MKQLYRDIKEKSWTLDWDLLKTHADPYDVESHWAGVLHPTPSRRFLEGHLTDFSCPSAKCFHGLPLRREHPDLPQATLYDLAKNKDKKSICAEIFAGGKEGTTGNGQGSGFSAGDTVRRYVFAC